MDLCGYHLRCSNQGSRCLDCRHNDEHKNKDYLYDVLNVFPQGKEAIHLVKEWAIDEF